MLASMVFPKKKNSKEIKEGLRKWALGSGGRFYHQSNSGWCFLAGQVNGPSGEVSILAFDVGKRELRLSNEGEMGNWGETLFLSYVSDHRLSRSIWHLLQFPVLGLGLPSVSSDVCSPH